MCSGADSERVRMSSATWSGTAHFDGAVEAGGADCVTCGLYVGNRYARDSISLATASIDDGYSVPSWSACRRIWDA